MHFSCVAPGAESVCVAGEFNNWDPTATPMERQQSGEWSAMLRLLPGTYEFKYVADGTWCCEPSVDDGEYCGEDAVLNSFGTKNRVIEVR